MNKKTPIIAAVFLCFAYFSSSAPAQQLTGSLKGTIIDPDGSPLPGVTVTATSEAIMGAQAYISSETGAYRFPALPPGTYKLAAELTGFNTLTRENIVIRVGAVVTIDLAMEVSAVKEEVTVTAPSPAVDVESTKIAVVMDGEFLKNIPMARDLYDIMAAAPGAVAEGQTARRTYTVHGSTTRGNTTAFDGVNMNDPAVLYPITNINVDVMEEVESITAGHPASVGYTDGAYVNIVTRSGGNRFSGGALVYLTNEGMAQHLWTDEQVQALGVTKPEVSKSWFDGSLTLGGPVVKDRVWFFTNGRYISHERKTDFIGPWTDFRGYTHNPYDWTHEEKMGFIKLTGQLSPAVKLVGMFNFVGIYEPMFQDPGPRTNRIATQVWDHETTYTGTALMSYVLNQNTLLDVRLGFVRRWFPLPLQPEARDLPWIDDLGDLYGSLTSAGMNQTFLRKRMQFGAYFTRFQDDFIGGNHEFKGGVEYEIYSGDYDWWRKDNMNWILDSRYPPKNYAYGTYGRAGFHICGQESGSTESFSRGERIGAYIQDSVTLAKRLTLNIGLRFERLRAWQPATEKEQAAPLSYWVGENVVKPYVAATYPSNFPNGLNPWAAMTCPEWKNIITWNDLSPRFGLTYDPFGDGKTAVKFSFSRYTEYLMNQYLAPLHPFYTLSFGFNWTDDNNTNYPDIGDTFVIRPFDFRVMDPEFRKKMVDPKTRSPLADELTLGVWRELFRDFSLGLTFIYKEKKNIVEAVYYAPDTGESWYHPDQAAAKKYWVPFTTTVPGTDNYPAQTVTLYIRRNDSPEPFTRWTNVPELERKYWAAELIFNKRMSHGWQLGGSVVYSKTYGNIGGWFDDTSGWTGLGSTPNNYVNSYGRINTDRPLQIKLFGTVSLPYRIFLSAFYAYLDGAPWTRNVAIRPPAAWTTATNTYRDFYTVNIEAPGSRRLKAWNELDLRLEKEFSLGRIGRLGAYIDVVNLLGYSSVDVGLDDVFRWEPVAEGVNQPGTKTLETSYKVVSSVAGTREVKASLRFSF